ARVAQGRQAAAADDEGPGRVGVEHPAFDAGMVRDGPQLRALRQPGRRLRRHPEVPQDAEAMSGRAIQRASALLDDLKRPALAEHPDDAHAQTMLAHCLGQQGRHKEADAAVGDAIRLAPDYGYAHRIRGWLLWLRDDWRGAEPAYREALRLDPADIDAYQGLS